MGWAARLNLPGVVVDTPVIIVGALTFLEGRVKGITNRRRVCHDKGEEAGYDGEESESHGFEYVLLF